jgi:hypothetical protein
MARQLVGRRPLAFCILAPLLAIAFPLDAGGDEGDHVFYRVSDKTLERIIVKLKLPFEQKRVQLRDTTITTFNLIIGKGYRATLANYGGTLQLSAGGFAAKGNQGPSLERINDWNASRLYTRAFVDKTGGGVLVSDLTIFSGTTERIIETWVSMYDGVITDFGKFVW